MKNDSGPQNDLGTYLRQAAAMVRLRLADEKTKLIEKNSADEPIDSDRLQKTSINQLCMLEELIKEQVPHENSGHPTRKAR